LNGTLSNTVKTEENCNLNRIMKSNFDGKRHVGRTEHYLSSQPGDNGKPSLTYCEQDL
jgi:hypothetical protein